jgi:hypothetical protein
MGTLRTIFTERGKHLFIVLTTFMMLLVTSYRPFMMHNLSSAEPVTHHQEAASDETPSSENITILSAVYEAIVPIYKIQIAVIYNAIFELQLIEEIIENINVGLALPQSSYFKILFRTFISPNAP